MNYCLILTDEFGIVIVAVRQADMAQLVEQRIRNAWVRGSSPLIGSYNLIGESFVELFFLSYIFSWFIYSPQLSNILFTFNTSSTERMWAYLPTRCLDQGAWLLLPG